MMSPLKNENGLSLIEVLVGSLVFMIGFSILIALLNATSDKVSTADLVEATSLAEQTLLELQTQSPDDGVTECTRSVNGKQFRVTCTVSSNAGLTGIRVEVSRKNARRSLADMYYEYQTTQ